MEKAEEIKKEPEEKKEAEEKKLTPEEKKKIRELVDDWVKIMAHAGIENKLDQTYSLQDIRIKPYGYECNIRIVPPLTFDSLQSQRMTRVIEDNLGCIFVTTRLPKKKIMQAKFITKDIPEIMYEPIPQHPYELYLGTGIEGEPIKADMLKYPHVVVQGATNMGKTKMIDTAVTNIVNQCSPDQVSLYIIAADKPDQVIYRKCKHTRAYADTLEKTLALTGYLVEVVEKRGKIIEPLMEDGICSNISGFNKVHRQYKHGAFTYIYVIIDEYSTLMPGNSDRKDIKKLKQAIQDNIERLIQVGRYVGLYLVIGLQRSTIDKLPPFIKAMCNTVATFRVNNERSSYVAIDSNEAVNLKPRENIIKTDKKEMAMTVTIPQDVILKYTQEFRWSPGQYHEFMFESWIIKDQQQKKREKKKKEQQQQTATKAEIPEEELQKLEKPEPEVKKLDPEPAPAVELQAKPKKTGPHFDPNWTDPCEGKTVIDQTKIDLSNSEKPRKEHDNVNKQG